MKNWLGSPVKRLFDAFNRCESGNFAVTLSVMAVPLMGMLGLAVDYASMWSVQSKLQQVADSAALASAKEYALSTTSDSDVFSIVNNFVEAQYSINKSSQSYVAVNTEVQPDRSGVSVDLAYYWKPFFAHHIQSDVLPIKVKSVAALAGSEAMCVLALEPTGKEKLNMRGKGSIEAKGCAVHVNSTDKSGLSVGKSATMSASNIYSAGGFDGGPSPYKPTPIPDSPPMADPLAERVAPAAGSCDYKDFVPWEWDNFLEPGTYCGGIYSSGNVNIYLKPGVYIFKDGPLSLNGKGVLNGDYVSLVFEGEKSTLDIGPSMAISLKAPKTGPTSGILIFEDRSASKGRVFAIRSKNAEQMEGAIYLPNGKFFVDKASRVGQASKWSAIIAYQIEVGDGPEIQINSNYSGSDVPAPIGVKGTGDRIYLTN